MAAAVQLGGARCPAGVPAMARKAAEAGEAKARRNLIGGVVLVGAVYWFVYLRPRRLDTVP